jgi:hypothetical protein
VPCIAINKTGNVVGGEFWRYPTLKAPITKKKKQGEGKEANFMRLSVKKNGNKECNTNGQKRAGEAVQIETRGNSAHKGQQDWDQRPGIFQAFFFHYPRVRRIRAPS